MKNNYYWQKNWKRYIHLSGWGVFKHTYSDIYTRKVTRKYLKSDPSDDINIVFLYLSIEEHVDQLMF